MRVVTALAVAGMLLGACTERAERVYFDGNYYPAKAKRVSRDDREAFVATVRRTDQGLAGAREAGRHAGVEYCIENYGTSGIDWAAGPDAPKEALTVRNGSLVLRGRCVTW